MRKHPTTVIGTFTLVVVMPGSNHPLPPLSLSSSCYDGAIMCASDMEGDCDDGGKVGVYVSCVLID